MNKVSLLIALIFASMINLNANNLKITNTVLEAQDPVTKTRNISFDISWDNSWRNDLAGGGNAEPYNYDAVWVFVKFVKNGGPVTHATLSSDASKHTAPAGSTIKPTSDGKGIFIYRDANGTGSNNWTNVKLQWTYGSDISETGNSFLDSIVGIQVFGIEMVYVPQGGFWVGDPNGPSGPTYSLYTYGSNGAYYINSENSINYGPVNGQLYSSWSPTINTTKVVPTSFPKGYNAYFIMKYEGTNKMYVDFLNALSNSQQTTRSSTIYSDMSQGFIRGGIYKDDIYKTSHPDRVIYGPTTNDIIAYLDWSGLRLMSEFEYEKACRGTLLPITFEFAWGSSKINQISGSYGLNRIYSSSVGTYEDGTETLDTVNCNFWGSGFYRSNGSTYLGNGPVRAGIFAKSNTSRYWAGATYYGVMEMTGNVSEPVVYIMDNSGNIINYSPVHGDGSLDNSGNSNVANGISGVVGIRSKGGNWNSGYSAADNNVAARNYTQGGQWGIRGVRTAP